MQCNAMQRNAMQCNAMQCMYACMHVCMYVFFHFHNIMYVILDARIYTYIYIWTPSYCEFLQQSLGQNHTTSSVEQPDAICRMRISSQNANGWPGSTVCDGHTSWGPMDGSAVMRSKTLSRAGEGDFLQRSQTGFVSAVRLESQEQTNLCASDCRLTLFILGLLLAPGTRRIAATNPYTAAKRCGNTCTLNGALWHHRRDKQHFCPLGILKQRKANQFSS